MKFVIFAPPRGVKRFPNAGNRLTDGATRYVGSEGYYWSSDQYNTTIAYSILVYSGYPAGGLSNYYGDKLCGFPVRCVRL